MVLEEPKNIDLEHILDSQTTLASDASSPYTQQAQLDSHAQSQRFTQPTQPSAAPDGGWNAWLCVLGGFCALFVSFGFLTACGIFQFYYKEVLFKDESVSTIAWIPTTALFVMYVIGPFIGRLADIVGPRIVMIPACILIVFSIFMLSLSTEYYQTLLSEGVAFGLGSGCLFLIPMMAVSQWFSKRRGLALGITASGSSLGGVCFPLFIPILIEKHGFAAAVRWTALLMACFLIISIVTVKSRLPPQGWGNRKSGGLASLKDLKAWSWILFFIGCFLIMWGFFAPYNYLPLFASLRAHTGSNMSNAIVAITNAGSTVGRIVPGWLSDRFGQFNVMMIVTAASGILILAFWLPLEFHATNATTIIFGATYGFVSGGYISLLTPCVVRLCRGRLEDLGVKMGAFLMVIAVAALTGLPILGAIKDTAAADDFVGLIAFGGVVITIGSGFIAAASVAFKRESA